MSPLSHLLLPPASWEPSPPVPGNSRHVLTRFQKMQSCCKQSKKRQGTVLSMIAALLLEEHLVPALQANAINPCNLQISDWRSPGMRGFLTQVPEYYPELKGVWIKNTIRLSCKYPHFWVSCPLRECSLDNVTTTTTKRSCCVQMLHFLEKKKKVSFLWYFWNGMLPASFHNKELWYIILFNFKKSLWPYF